MSAFVFKAFVTCAVGIACGLTGSFTPSASFESRVECERATAQALQQIGENVSRFNIECRRRRP